MYPKLFATPETDHLKSGFALFSPMSRILHIGKKCLSWSDSEPGKIEKTVLFRAF